MGSAPSHRTTPQQQSDAAPAAMTLIAQAWAGTITAAWPTTARVAMLDATRSAQSGTHVG